MAPRSKFGRKWPEMPRSSSSIEHRQAASAAIRAGLEGVKGDVVVVYMADLSDSPEDVVAYYRKIREGYDCVFGSRFIKGSTVENYPIVKLVCNRIVNQGIRLLFWTRFNDLTNAFKAYRTAVIRDCGPYRPATLTSRSRCRWGH